MAIADELVVARALQLGDVLDARRDLAGRQRAWPGRDPEHALGGGRIVFRIVVDTAIFLRELPLGLGRQPIRECRLQADGGAQQKNKGAHHEAPTLMVPSAITVPERILPLSVLRILIWSPAAPGCSVT